MITLRNIATEDVVAGQAILSQAGFDWLPGSACRKLFAFRSCRGGNASATPANTDVHLWVVALTGGGNLGTSAYPHLTGGGDVVTAYFGILAGAVNTQCAQYETAAVQPVFLTGINCPAFAEFSIPQSYFENCWALVTSRRTLLTENQVGALERQLQSLLADEDELRSEGIIPSLASLSSLIDFFSGKGATVHPRLSITRRGCFSAAWSPRRRAKLTLTFLDSDCVHWAGVDLDAEPPAHASGRSTLEALAVPEPFLQWMYA